MSFYNDGYAHGFAAGHAQALREEGVKDAPDVAPPVSADIAALDRATEALDRIVEALNVHVAHPAEVDDHHPWKRWAPDADATGEVFDENIFGLDLTDQQLRTLALDAARDDANWCAENKIRTQDTTTTRAAAYYHFLVTGQPYTGLRVGADGKVI